VGWGIRGLTINQGVDSAIAVLNATWPGLFSQASKAEIDGLVSIVNFVFKGIIDNASHYLSHGNHMVFGEIAYHYSRYGVAMCNATTLHDNARAQFLDFQRNFTANQSMLATAFESIFQVHYNTSLSDKIRAEHLLISNYLTGLDEQTNLDYDLKHSFPPPLVLPIGGRNISIAWSMLFTRTIMVLNAPAELFFCGWDVPNRPWDHKPFSAYLTDIELPQLQKLLVQFEQQPHSLQGTAAQDWAFLSQRMRYVAGLFRSRQDDWNNTCWPFSVAQLGTIFDEGAAPDNAGLCTYNCCEKHGHYQD
jgi:hypothetical protein